jgi:hypothetical protein
LALTKKLRKELGISDEQHKMWLEDVKAANAAGNLLYWYVAWAQARAEVSASPMQLVFCVPLAYAVRYSVGEQAIAQVHG